VPWKRTRGGWTKAGKGGYVRSRRMYEALRRKGYSKAKAARITNGRGRR
jgi:hypothetical protein